MNNRYIGVFDSGVGGLTVVKSILDSMPNENIIYFGDTAHVPYGTRTKDDIIRLALNNADFLSSFDIKAIVIACNTVDSNAHNIIEDAYTVPVFGIIEPAAKKAVEATRNGKIGVIATNATIDSGAYEQKIKKLKPDAEVFSVACPKLVPLIEQCKFRKGDPEIEEALEEYLLPLKLKGIDTLVLGCTHYPLIKDIAAEILPDTVMVSSSDAETEALRAALEKDNLFNFETGSDTKFFVSGDTDIFGKTAKVFMGNLFDKAEHVEV